MTFCHSGPHLLSGLITRFSAPAIPSLGPKCQSAPAPWRSVCGRGAQWGSWQVAGVRRSRSLGAAPMRGCALHLAASPCTYTGRLARHRSWILG